MKDGEKDGKNVLSLRLLLGAGTLMFSGGLSASVLAFIQGAMVARELGASDFGAWAVVVTFCTIIKNLLSFRTREPLTKYIVSFRSERRPAMLLAVLGGSLSIDFITSLASLAITILLSPLAARWMINGEVSNHLFWIYGCAVMLAFMENTWFSVARDLKSYRKIAVWNPIFAAGQLIVVSLLLFAHGLTLYSLAVAYLLVAAAKSCVYSMQLLRWCSAAYGIELRDFRWGMLKERRRELADYWIFMRATYAWSLVSELAKNADTLILGLFRSDSEVGLYKLAKGLISQIQAVSISFSAVIYQDFNEILAGKKTRLLKAKLMRVGWIWLLLIAAGFAAMAASIRPAIAFVYGPEFAAASVPFAILSVGAAFSAGFFWAQPMLLALGGIRRSTIIIISTGICSVAACLLSVPRLGQTGAAWSVTAWWVSCSCALAIASILALSKYENASAPAGMARTAES